MSGASIHDFPSELQSRPAASQEDFDRVSAVCQELRRQVRAKDLMLREFEDLQTATTRELIYARTALADIRSMLSQPPPQE